VILTDRDGARACECRDSSRFSSLIDASEWRAGAQRCLFVNDPEAMPHIVILPKAFGKTYSTKSSEIIATHFSIASID
jgi:hypothetical protein